MGTRIDLHGQVFGRLTVVARASNRNGNAYWECICSCGATKVVVGYDLRAGRSNSCGCLQREATSVAKTKLGMRCSSIYNTWSAMMDRCYNANNKDYKRYGGRGITVHKPWHDSTTFILEVTAEIGERPAGLSLDRIDNSKGYEPGNLRWATQKQQVANRSLQVHHG